IKFREGFRPFAPSVLEEDAQFYFDLKQPSPYMLITAQVLKSRQMPEPDNYKNFGLHKRLYHCRSDMPSITHVDYSARIQTVDQSANLRFYSLIQEFKKLTGYSLLINTSFNIQDEPIVCSPEEAYECFMKTDMDCLVIGNFFLEK